MEEVDLSLLDLAQSHFFDAIATFGRPGDDLVRVSQDIAQAAKIAGFTKRGRRRLLENLYAFVASLERRSLDPFSRGGPVADRESLFSMGRLRGLFDADSLLPDRAMIDQLIADTRLYDSAKAVKELLDFTTRLRNIAPFNAMLLHIQKPGLSYAARPKDWWDRFRRRPKRHARPLVVLRNFGPVEFVYDILDTEGVGPLPASAFSFPTAGKVPPGWIAGAQMRLTKEEIGIIRLDRGDNHAGHARCLSNHKDKDRLESFEVGINGNHEIPTQIVTLLHELAHIYLGHCGADLKRSVKLNRPADIALREVEAETVAYLVAKRTGLSPRSEKYLDTYKGAFDQLNLHRIMRVSSAIERLLDLPFRESALFD